MTEPTTHEPTVEHEAEEEHVVEEEVTTVEGWAPSVTLEVKDEVHTGEEEEETIYSQRSKLYRWVPNTEEDGPAGEWKERGTGDAKFLSHKISAKTRLLMRQEKTGKIIANHYVVEGVDPFYALRPNAGSDKCWVWMAQDFSEEEVVIEQFALKFGTAEKAKGFQEAFEGAKVSNVDEKKAEE
jgi:Ran-binding protein 1